MVKNALLAAALFQMALATNCAAQPATASGTLFCQADHISQPSPQPVTQTDISEAMRFCDALQTAFAETLGSPVSFASKTEAEWVIKIDISTYRADAIIMHNPTQRSETMQFDIMDAALTPERLQPFALDLAAFAIALR